MSQQRKNQKALRYAVFQRDKGICSGCGYDCEFLRVRLLALPYHEREMERRRLGISHGRTSYFDVHHIKALVEGGTDALSNATTLCWKCHSAETRALAGERAAAGREARAMGYRRMVTYTLKDETGVSLVAAGWRFVYHTKPNPKGWDMPGRPRVNTHPLGAKTLWEQVA